MNEPKVLFADEPTANLDTTSSTKILELFRKLNSDLKLTIIMVTHEPEDKKYVDRVIWLKDGVIEKGDRIQDNDKIKRQKSDTITV